MPQIDGLTVEDLLRYARDKPNMMRHLPDQGGWNHFDKKWISDVIYTLDAEGMTNMVNKALQKRKEKLEQS